MALSKLESLPAEVRIRIFEFVFQGSHVNVNLFRQGAAEYSSNYESNKGVLSTSKLLYRDARSALASKLELQVDNIDLDNVEHYNLDPVFSSESIRSFYCPLIRRLQINWLTKKTQPAPSYDTAVFKNLKSLRLQIDIFSPLFVVIYHDSQHEQGRKLVMDCLVGKSDRILKTAGKAELCRLYPWVRKILADPDRTFQIVSEVRVSGEMENNSSKEMILGLQFDLDSLESVFKHWKISEGTKSLRGEYSWDNHTEIWGDAKGNGGWGLLERKAWDRTEGDSVFKDPATAGIRFWENGIYAV
jgi:hypothetical protein